MWVMFVRTSSSPESVVNPAASNKFYEVVLCNAGRHVSSAIYSEVSAPWHCEVKANICRLFVAEF